MSIQIEVGDWVVDMSAEWDSLRTYKVRSLGPPVEVGGIFDVMDREPPTTFPSTASLFLSPFASKARRKNPIAHEAAHLIRDLASSLIRAATRMPVNVLVASLQADSRLVNLPVEFIEGCLRCSVASEIFGVFSDGRKRTKEFILCLSSDQQIAEDIRLFAGSFAGELNSLSDRIRLIVQHTSSVGTYRENLLQTLLRKNLPERYHVATGFIYGCSRQVDILIYDRIDYAPVFREDNLVVVLPESVRAAIEVKTNITAVQLESSLSLMSEVAATDDGMPPFFKGVFGFESDLEARVLCEAIVEHYTREPEDDLNILEFDNYPIGRPFDHVTCVCVLGKAFAYVGYPETGESKQLTPTLMMKSSASGLEAQAAYFLQMLLAYLHYQALKHGGNGAIERMLGADTRDEEIGPLTIFPTWGAYFALSEGVHPDAEQEVEALERQVRSVYRWLTGQPFLLQ